MASRKLVGELIEFYYELDDEIERMAGNVEAYHITELRNIQLRIDKLLTNVSKRWAEGNRLRGYIPIRFINEEEESIQVNVNPL